MNYYIIAIKKYAVFYGRARRKEFWMFFLFNVIFGIIAQILDYILKTSFGVNTLFLNYGYIYTAYSLFTFIPNFSIASRRLHDIGKSAWILLIFYVPIIIFCFLLIVLKNPMVFLFFLLALGLFVWLMVLFCKNGDPKENVYGPDPKAIGNDQFDFMNNTYSAEK